MTCRYERNCISKILIGHDNHENHESNETHETHENHENPLSLVMITTLVIPSYLPKAVSSTSEPFPGAEKRRSSLRLSQERKW